ncbi:MAG: VOC family protein [Ginsengibacter sp.]
MSNTENIELNKDALIRTSIAPWLSVQNSASAINFYKTAFGAVETYRLETPDGSLVAKLSVNGAEFWVSSGTPDNENPTSESLGGGTIRIILTVANPDPLFAKALEAGATQIFPIGEDYGWRLGRLVDPFGLHWEIGHPLAI